MKRLVFPALLVLVWAAPAAALEGSLGLELETPVIMEGQNVTGAVRSSLQVDSIRISWINGFGETIFATVVNVSGGAPARFTFRVRDPATAVNFVSAAGRAGSASAVFTVFSERDDFWRGFVVVADAPPESGRAAVPFNLPLGLRAALCRGARECVLAGSGGLRPMPQGLVSPGVLELSEEAVEAARRRFAREGSTAALEREASLSDTAEITRLAGEAARQAARLRTFAPAGYVAVDGASVARGDAVLDLSFAEADLAGFRRFVSARFSGLSEISMHWGRDIGSLDALEPETGRDVKAAVRESPEKLLDIAPWALHREYMDGRIAAAIMDVERAIAQAAASPGAGAINWNLIESPTGFAGARAPCAYGGADWTFLSGISDFVIMDTQAPRWSWRLARDIDSTARVLARIDAASPDAGEAAWRAVADGMAGVVLDNYSDYLAQSAESILAAQAAGRAAAADALAEALSAGALPAQVTALSNRTARVALVYSPASLRAAWMMRYLACGDEPPQAKASAEALEAWDAILSDLGVDFQWVSIREVEIGALPESGFTAVVLPECWCLSPRAVAALAAWCERGGTLIADHAAGLMNGDYRAYETSPADGLFGIKRRALRNRAAIFAFAAQAGDEGGPRLGDAGIEIAAGARAAETDGAATEITRPLGRGGTVYLNLVLSGYKTAPAATKAMLAAVARRALETAGYTRPLRVLQAGEEVAARVSGYSFGATRIFVIEVPETPGAREEAPLEVVFPGAGYVYDLRSGEGAGRAFGAVDRVSLPRPPAGPLVLAVTFQSITGLPMEVEFDGRSFYVRATLMGGEALGTRLFRVVFYTPSGRRAWQLSRTVSAENATALVSVNLPIDAPRGTWRVLVKDLATGMAAWRDVIVGM